MSQISVYHFDDVEVDLRRGTLRKSGQLVPLEPKAFKVLLYLIENRERLISKAELLEAIWRETFVTENAMTRSIAQLRRALGDDAKEPRYIVTVPTRGYRFIAEVRESTAQTISTVYAGLSDTVQALDWLENAHLNRSAWLVFFKAHPYLDAVRDEPRFKKLLALMNL